MFKRPGDVRFEYAVVEDGRFSRQVDRCRRRWRRSNAVRGRRPPTAAASVWKRDTTISRRITDKMRDISAAHIKGAPRIIHWGQDRRAELRPRTGVVGFFGRGSNPLPPARGYGERCEIPSGVRGGAVDRPKGFFSHYFHHSGWPLLTL